MRPPARTSLTGLVPAKAGLAPAKGLAPAEGLAPVLNAPVAAWLASVGAGIASVGVVALVVKGLVPVVKGLVPVVKGLVPVVKGLVPVVKGLVLELMASCGGKSGGTNRSCSGLACPCGGGNRFCRVSKPYRANCRSSGE